MKRKPTQKDRIVMMVKFMSVNQTKTLEATINPATVRIYANEYGQPRGKKFSVIRIKHGYLIHRWE